MFDKVIGLLSIPITLVMIWMLVRQVNKPQPVIPRSTWVSLGIAALTLLVNLLFLKKASPGIFGPLFLAAGLVLGMARGRSTRLSVEQGTVIARQSILHLVFWGISAAATQLLASFAPARLVAGGLTLMFFSTGTTFGSGIDLLLRQQRFKKEYLKSDQSKSPDNQKYPNPQDTAKIMCSCSLIIALPAPAVQGASG